MRRSVLLIESYKLMLKVKRFFENKPRASPTHHVWMILIAQVRSNQRLDLGMKDYKLTRLNSLLLRLESVHSASYPEIQA